MSTKEKFELNVTGMTCDSCAVHVEKALQDVPGVLAVNIPDWKSGQAILTADPAVDDDTLVAAVEKIGYRADIVPRRSATAPRPPAGNGRTHDYDLIVIGTGGGGMGAAIKAAELGFRAAIIEGGTIGGTCVNIGCVPSKALIRAAAAYHNAGHHPFKGIKTRAESVDWAELIRHKDELVAGLRQAKYVDVLASYDNITLIKNWAKLQSDTQVVLDDGRVLSAGKIVIATGARPYILPIPGIEAVDVLNSTTAMALEKQPASLIVLGGRAVALELSQAFARLGTRVTILQRSERLIPEHEPDIAAELADILRDEGIAIHTGVTLQNIRADGDEKIITAAVDGEVREFRAEQVLMALGRTPNTRDMGLAEAGVELDEKGFIKVTDRMETSNPNIYAVGDVTNRPKFVYVAAAAGGIAAANALAGEGKSLNLQFMPDVIFTDPQVASVGLTESAAKAKGYEVKVSTLPLAYVPRALAARETRGLIKLIADRNTNRLLGAHVLAAEGGEIMQTAVLAMKFGLEYGCTVTDLRDMLFPYLVQVEGIKLAAQTFEKDVAQLSCCAG